MTRKTMYILVGLLLTGLLGYRCQPKQAKQDGAETQNNTFAIHGSIRELSLNPGPTPEFPDREGKAEFVANCAICHSLRYISMQPDFAPNTWKAEVTKMVAKYHAPIDSNTCNKIISYLVAIKSGKK